MRHIAGHLRHIGFTAFFQLRQQGQRHAIAGVKYEGLVSRQLGLHLVE